MSIHSFRFPKPDNGTTFETYCLKVFASHLEIPNLQKYARPGQVQHGVDLLGVSAKHGPCGIQCKLRNGPRRLTKDEVIAEVEKAKEMAPRLAMLVIATSGPRDNSIQELAADLTRANTEAGLFSVAVYSWDDLEEILKSAPELAAELSPGWLPVAAGSQEGAAEQGDEVLDHFVDRAAENVRYLDSRGLFGLVDQALLASLKLADVYVEVGLAQADSDEWTRATVWEVLSVNRLCQVTGELGTGKSALLRYVAHTMLQSWRDGSAAPPDRRTHGLPVLTSASAIALWLAAQPGEALYMFLEQSIGAAPQSKASSHLGQLVSAGRVLLMIDGLDELSKVSTQAAVIVAIEELSLSRPGLRVIVTTRPNKSPPLRGNFSSWRLQPLNNYDVHQCVERLGMELGLVATSQEAQRLVQELSRTDGIAELLRNPLLLTLALLLRKSVAPLPSSPVEFYYAALRTFAESWPAWRARSQGRTFSESESHVLPIWGKVAYAAFRAGQQSFAQAELRLRIRDAVVSGGTGLSTADDLLVLEHGSSLGLIVSEHHDLWRFCHQVFADLLTAIELAAEMAGRDQTSGGSRWRPPAGARSLEISGLAAAFASTILGDTTRVEAILCERLDDESGVSALSYEGLLLASAAIRMGARLGDTTKLMALNRVLRAISRHPTSRVIAAFEVLSQSPPSPTSLPISVLRQIVSLTESDERSLAVTARSFLARLAGGDPRLTSLHREMLKSGGASEEYAALWLVCKAQALSLPERLALISKAVGAICWVLEESTGLRDTLVAPEAVTAVRRALANVPPKDALSLASALRSAGVDVPEYETVCWRALGEDDPETRGWAAGNLFELDHWTTEIADAYESSIGRDEVHEHELETFKKIAAAAVRHGDVDRAITALSRATEYYWVDGVIGAAHALLEVQPESAVARASIRSSLQGSGYDGPVLLQLSSGEARETVIATIRECYSSEDPLTRFGAATAAISLGDNSEATMCALESSLSKAAELADPQPQGYCYGLTRGYFHWLISDFAELAQSSARRWRASDDVVLQLLSVAAAESAGEDIAPVVETLSKALGGDDLTIILQVAETFLDNGIRHDGLGGALRRCLESHDGETAGLAAKLLLRLEGETVELCAEVEKALLNTHGSEWDFQLRERFEDGAFQRAVAEGRLNESRHMWRDRLYGLPTAQLVELLEPRESYESTAIARHLIARGDVGESLLKLLGGWAKEDRPASGVELLFEAIPVNQAASKILETLLSLSDAGEEALRRVALDGRGAGSSLEVLAEELAQRETDDGRMRRSRLALCEAVVTRCG